MKHRLFAVILIPVLLLVLMVGCAGPQRLEHRMDAIEDSVERKFDRVEDSVENTIRDAVTPPPSDPRPGAEALTQAEAESIALSHAGFAADEVEYLRSEYEIDDGVPEYQVEFRQGRWEYDYEIHAETGKIISYDKDN